MKITVEVSEKSHRYFTLMDLLRRDHYQYSIEESKKESLSHVCGAQGFNPLLGDTCKACELEQQIKL